MAKEIITIENLKRFKEDADETYQPKGDYATKGDIPDVSELTEQVAENTKDIEDLKSGEGVDLSDYAKTKDIEDGTIKAAEATHAESADTATTASKLGSADVGSGTKPIYLAAGTATASSSTVGSATIPVYLNAGTLTATSGIATETYADNAASSAEDAAEAYTKSNAFNAISASGTKIMMTRGDNTTEEADVSIDLSGYATTASVSAAQETADNAANAAKAAQETADGKLDEDTANGLYDEYGAASSLQSGITSGTIVAGEAAKVSHALTLEGVSGFSYDGSNGKEIPLAGTTAGLMSAEDKAFIDAWKNPATTSLQNTSWDEIKAEAIKGTARNYWKIGDTKTITLTTGEEITVRIIGFDHDAANSITFEMVDCLSTTYTMNSSNTNAGGWDGSVLRSTLNGTIFNTLPSELQSVIRTVSKKATAGSQSTDITTSQDKLFLLSLAEIYSKEGLLASGSYGYVGTTHYDAYCGEGEQYEYYKGIAGDGAVNTANTNLRKQRNGSNVNWWLRSPYVSNSTYFWYFHYSNAYCGTGGASGSCSVAFSFCV